MSWNHIQLSVVLSFYLTGNDENKLRHLIWEYTNYPDFILDKVLFVFVDEGATLPYEIQRNNLNLILLRMGPHTTRDEAAGRNLGVVYAKSDKVLLTDLDHILPLTTLGALTKKGNPKRKAYRLPRLDPDYKKISPHSNILFLSRAHFLKNFGYDEELGKGPEGNNALSNETVPAMRGGIWIQKCFSNTNSPTEINEPTKVGKITKHTGHSREFLNFPFEIVRVQHRAVPARSPHPNWWKGWWLRWAEGVIGLF
jgi:hypothetical protein